MTPLSFIQNTPFKGCFNKSIWYFGNISLDKQFEIIKSDYSNE